VNFLERFSTSPQISFCPQPTHFYNHKPVWMRISRTIFVLKKNRSNTTDFSRFFLHVQILSFGYDELSHSGRRRRYRWSRDSETGAIPVNVIVNCAFY